MFQWLGTGWKHRKIKLEPALESRLPNAWFQASAAPAQPEAAAEEAPGSSLCPAAPAPQGGWAEDAPAPGAPELPVQSPPFSAWSPLLSNRLKKIHFSNSGISIYCFSCFIYFHSCLLLNQIYKTKSFFNTKFPKFT